MKIYKEITIKFYNKYSEKCEINQKNFYIVINLK
jgi:hypothetical protein